MIKLKYLLIIVIMSLMLTGCGTKTTITKINNYDGLGSD